MRQAYKKYDDVHLKLYIQDASKFNNPKMPAYNNIIAEEDYPDLLEYIKHLGIEAAGKKN